MAERASNSDLFAGMRRWASLLTLLALLPVLGQAQWWAAQPQHAAKVVQASGRVSFLKDAQEWALHVGDTVQMQQVIVTGVDGHALFQVTDGSTFEVFPNSQVTFRNNPGNLRDLIDVWLGRVKVHIQKLGGQPNPHSVRTPSALISVRGTTFDVVVEDQEESTLIAVEEGQVAVQHALLPRDGLKLLNGGDTLRVYKNVALVETRVDKGAVAQRVLRALSEALQVIAFRGPRLPTGFPGGGGTGPVVTDPDPRGGAGGSTVPPPPPPPPAPPPPLPPN